MVRKTCSEVVVGIAPRDAAGGPPPAEAVMAAVEDAGIVPGPERPLTVVAAQPLPGLDALPGVAVVLTGNGRTPLETACELLAREPDTAVALHDPELGPAVVLLGREPAGRGTYGPLGDNPAATLSALTPKSAARADDEPGTAAGGPDVYRVEWEPIACAGTRAPVPGRWLLLGGTELSDLFEETVAEVPATGRLDGVLCAADRAETLLAALRTVDEAGLDAPVWCVTGRAVTTGPHDAPVDVAAAGVWGLGRAAALERPATWAGLIDLPPSPAGDSRRLLAAVLTGAAGPEDQTAVRGDGLLAPRLTRIVLPPAAAPPLGGTVLVTGGTGALGGHVARRIAARGPAVLVLLSRRGAQAPGAAELVGELEALGSRVRVVAADAADRPAMAALVADLAAAGTPVEVVVHAAGVVREAPLEETGAAELAEDMAGKVDGALVLDELLPDAGAFVLFSSISGVWGSPGQASYSAANACLIGLAQRRRARGAAASAVAWGPWSGGGMVVPELEPMLRGIGLPPLSVPAALDALEAVVAADTDALVADVSWPSFLPVFTSARPSPLLSRIAGSPPSRDAR